MYPKLFEIGPIPVYSYGLMLGIAFLISSAIFTKELKRFKIDENVGVVITFIAIIAGLIGSKIFYILEEWNFGKGGPIISYFRGDVLFSPSGLTFYGGLVLAIIIIYFYVKSKKLSLLRMFDCMAPAAILGYGIARIGCHLSGDGCYGIPVNGTFWEFLGYSYSNGIIPTHPGVFVHPTPLYELLISLIVFLILWLNRKKMKYTGQMFYLYLIFAGSERFLIEFIRLNPKVFFVFTQAQIISIILIVTGSFLLIYNSKSNDLILGELKKNSQKRNKI